MKLLYDRETIRMHPIVLEIPKEPVDVLVGIMIGHLLALDRNTAHDVAWTSTALAVSTILARDFEWSIR